MRKGVRRPRFLLEAADKILAARQRRVGNLDRHLAPNVGIERLPHLAHAPRPEGSHDHVGTEL
jgi:hypothetical protein